MEEVTKEVLIDAILQLFRYNGGEVTTEEIFSYLCSEGYDFDSISDALQDYCS